MTRFRFNLLPANQIFDLVIGLFVTFKTFLILTKQGLSTVEYCSWKNTIRASLRRNVGNPACFSCAESVKSELCRHSQTSNYQNNKTEQVYEHATVFAWRRAAPVVALSLLSIHHLRPNKMKTSEHGMIYRLNSLKACSITKLWWCCMPSRVVPCIVGCCSIATFLIDDNFLESWQFIYGLTALTERSHTIHPRLSEIWENTNRNYERKLHFADECARCKWHFDTAQPVWALNSVYLQDHQFLFRSNKHLVHTPGYIIPL